MNEYNPSSAICLLPVNTMRGRVIERESNRERERGIEREREVGCEQGRDGTEGGESDHSRERREAIILRCFGVCVGSVFVCVQVTCVCVCV